MYFLWYLLIGLAAGWIANLIVKGNGSGLIINLVVGLIGSLLGGWLFSLFGVVAVGTVGSLLTSILGAVVLLWIVSLITSRNNKKIVR
ncbi:GlsB/YeaQ/YmgE family stress response membrane protein [uncultured Alistipes sp.]|uniref:GlsB/YeaQ/YmgE family stress response membrane protein n=1 Tax=uncultured Alistipes sp. TaxID=538949 RepID=UPI002605AA2F|nr:GlsB/YeaQ/YmgE family stress response membrane protein [uncultured Alistipes sp.]